MSEPHHSYHQGGAPYHQGGAPRQQGGVFHHGPHVAARVPPHQGGAADDHPRGAVRTVGSWVWALSPAWSLGFGTAPIMVHATVKYRHWAQVLLTAVYISCVVLTFIFAGADDGSTGDAIFSAALATNIFVGTGHALVVRKRVFDRKQRPASPTVEDRQRDILAVQAQRDRAREVAREIVTNEPNRAIELRIGRVDIPGRTFPDGALIDVNNVEVHRLGIEVEALRAHLPSLDRARKRLRGFSSVEDMSVALGLPPHLLDHVQEQLVFLPRYEA